MKKNILCCYQGGSYSGCVWEWNFFYIDKQGVFHNIFSSGCDGIDSANKLDVLDRVKSYTYSLENPEDLKEFAKETYSNLVYMVIDWFMENTDLPVEQQPYALCGECKAEIQGDDIILNNCGDEIRCSDCESCGACEICCEYVRQDEIILAFDKHNCEHYVCEYCKNAEDYQSVEERENLRFQAFTTGISDLFSSEMAWYWGL